MIYLLMMMKLKTVVTVCALLGLVATMVWINIALSSYINPPSPVYPGLEDSTFEDEISRIAAGERIQPSHPDVPVMVWWTQFSGDTGVQDCGEFKCFITNDRKYMNHPNLRNIFMYGTSVSATDLPLPRRGLDWSLLHEESPKNNQLFSHHDMMSLFNHTSTFRLASDLPLTTQYLEDVDSITDPRHYMPVLQKNRYMEEEGYAPVLYVQSGCDAPSNRDVWVKEFMKYIDVDSYGNCLHNKDLPAEMVGSEKMKSEKFLKFIGRYKFMLSLENAVCEDYVTEKLWRSLQAGVIPIYLGAPNVEKFLPNVNSAILIQNFSSVEAVANYVKMLNEDDEAYSQFLEHKLTGRVENRFLKTLLYSRRWGVSESQQLSLGNPVRAFQCQVCCRVANNLKFTNRGFSAAWHRANVSHYGCPIPVHPISNKIDGNDFYVQEWFRTKYAAEMISERIDEESLPEKEFKEQLFLRWTEAFRAFMKSSA